MMMRQIVDAQGYAIGWEEIPEVSPATITPVPLTITPVLATITPVPSKTKGKSKR